MRRTEPSTLQRREFAKKRIQALDLELQALSKFPNPSKGKIRSIKWSIVKFQRILQGRN